MYLVSPSNNTDEPGLDYRGIHLRENQIAADCQDLCNVDPKCLAWTYIKPGTQGIGITSCTRNARTEPLVFLKESTSCQSSK